MDAQELYNIQEAYQEIYQKLNEGPGFPAVKPANSPGEAGSMGLKMIQTPDGKTGYINKHSGGNVLPSGTVNKIMSGDLMVKNKTPKPTTQVAHLDLFDIIKGYLLDEGYADTNQAAIVIMANMSEEWKQSIVEGMGLSVGSAKLIGKLASNPATPEAQATQAAQKNITDPIGFAVKNAAKTVLSVGDDKNQQMMQKRRPN